MVKRGGAAVVSAALVVGAVAVLPPARAVEPYAVPPAAHEPVVTCDVPVAMSDGVTLRADLTRPEGPVEARPTILTVTGYNKAPGGYACEGGGGIAGDGAVWAEQGYNVLLVDDRGTGNSNGVWDSWGRRIHRDYEELLDWIAEQPWSDGSVGATGESYSGITALFLAQADRRRIDAGKDPVVATVWADVPMADAYRDVTFHGGQMNTAFIPLWLGLVAAMGALPPTWIDEDPVAGLATLLDHAQGDVGFQVGAIADFTTGGLVPYSGDPDETDLAYDGPFYDLRSPEDHAPELTVPVAWTGGWWDIFQRGELRLWDALSNSRHRLLFMTPTYHAAGVSHWDEMGLGSRDAVMLAWFDRWLRDADNGIDEIAPVNLFTMGRDEWQQAHDFPLPGTEMVELHLTGERGLDPEPASSDIVIGALIPGGVCSRTTAQWSAGLVGTGIPCEIDQRVDQTAGLVSSFTTEPLVEPLELTGPITATLWATLLQPDATFSVVVSDVAPDGEVVHVTSGVLQASHRALDPERTERVDGAITEPFHPFTRAAQRPVPIGEPTEYVIEVFPTSHELAPGHRLRLTVSGLDLPHVTPLPSAAAALPAPVVFHTGGGYPSRLLVPVVPQG